MKESTLQALTMHRDQGKPVGGFVTAVLENNLVQAICYADEDNLRDIVEITKWVYQEMPGGAWGSPSKVRGWRDNGGAEGFYKRRLRWDANSNRLEPILEEG